MAVLSNTGVRAGASGAGGAEKTWKADKSIICKPENGYPALYHSPGKGDTKRFTFNVWAKRGNKPIAEGADTSVSALFGWYSDSDSYGYIAFYGDGIRAGNRPKSGTISTLQTSARFVDLTNWYNIHFVWDTEQSTSTERMRLYVNGVRITDFSTYNAPDRYQEWVGGIGRDADGDVVKLQLLRDENTAGSAGIYPGYMYSPTYIDGGALEPTVFGEFDDYGNWREKAEDIYNEDGNLIVGTGVFRNINAGFQWSHFWSGNFLSGYTAASAFNNSTEDAAGNHSIADNSNTITWKPVMDLVAKTDIRLYMFVKGSSGGGVDFTVNNVSKWDDAKSDLGNNTDGWYSIGKTITASHGLTFSRDANGTNQTGLFAIEVDGCILVDNNVNRGFNLRFGAGHWNAAHFGYSWWTPDNQGALQQPRGSVGLPPEQDQAGYWKDPDISSLVLAVDGNNTTDKHHLAKGSGSAKTRTVNGNTTTSNAISCQHDYSLIFDGSGDNLEFADHADWDIGTGDYCLETWCYPVETNDEYIVGRTISGGGGDWFGLNFWGNGGSTGGSVRGGHKNNHSANGQELEVSYAWEPNQWHHLAVTRESGTSRLFVGGQCVGIDTSDTYDITSSNALFVGGASGYSFDGYIGMVRLYKGAHKYNKNFIPAKPALMNNGGITRDSSNWWERAPVSDVPSGSAWTPEDDDTTNTRPEYGGNTRGNHPTIWSLGPTTSGSPHGGSNPLGFGRGSTGNVFGIYDITSAGPAAGGRYWRTGTYTMPITEGKHFFCIRYPESGGNWSAVGVAWNHNHDFDDRVGAADGGVRWDEDGKIFANGDAGWTTDMVYAWQHTCAVAFDADTRKVWFGHTGSWCEDASGNTGDPAAGAYPAAIIDESPNGEYVFTVTIHGGNFFNSSIVFGQYQFGDEAPDGFYPVNSYFLPEPTVVDPKKYFFCKKYSGSNGAQNITGFDFKPGLVAIKQINDNSTRWQVQDILRGASKGFHFDVNDAEYTDATALTAFNSNGISVGGTAASHNASGKDYMLYGWYFGDSAKTNNTDGTITPTGQWSNPSSGTSMITFSNVPSSPSTIGHGLGAKPDFAILKKRGAAGNPEAWHWCQTSQTAGHIALPTAAAEVTSNTNIWNNTAPTSTVWTFGSDLVSTNDWIMYFFKSINGLQKFGKYRGSGTSSGALVVLGFEPALVWIKSLSTADSWYCIDNVRATYNQRDTYFKLDTDDQSKSDDEMVDFLSCGFKVRDTTDHINGANDTYIYCAWANSALKYNNATV